MSIGTLSHGAYCERQVGEGGDGTGGGSDIAKWHARYFMCASRFSSVERSDHSPAMASVDFRGDALVQTVYHGRASSRAGAMERVAQAQ